MKLRWPRDEGHRKGWASWLSLTAGSDAPCLSGLGLLTLEWAALAHPTHSGSMPSSLAALWAFSLCQVLAGQPRGGRVSGARSPLILSTPCWMGPAPAAVTAVSLEPRTAPGTRWCSGSAAHGDRPAPGLSLMGLGQGQTPGRACPHHRTCWDSGGSDCCRRVFPRRSKSSRPLLVGRDVCAGGRLSTLGAGVGWGGSVPSDDCRAYKGCGWVRLC